MVGPLVVNWFSAMGDVLRTLVWSPADDPPLGGHVIAEVPVELAVYSESMTHARGTLSLRRFADGSACIGIETEHPVYFARPTHRHRVALDDVLEVVWEPRRLGGRLRLTPMRADVFAALPLAPTGSVVFRVGLADRDAAAAFAHAVALVDLPI